MPNVRLYIGCALRPQFRSGFKTGNSAIQWPDIWFKSRVVLHLSHEADPRSLDLNQVELGDKLPISRSRVRV